MGPGCILYMVVLCLIYGSLVAGILVSEGRDHLLFRCLSHSMRAEYHVKPQNLGLQGMIIREAKGRNVAIKQHIITFGCQESRRASGA